MSINAAIKLPDQPSLEEIKAKHKATWEDGDYANFAKYMEAGAVEVLEGWNIERNKTLLDVGCGSGQTSIPAAKRGIKVTGVDIAENLIEYARQRSAKEKLNTRFDVGDAENLPTQTIVMTLPYPCLERCLRRAPIKWWKSLRGY